MTKKLDDFFRISKDDPKKAKDVFFTESFKDAYLSGDDRLSRIYHQLQLGRNREQIYEEFCITAGMKKPVKLSFDQESYQLTRDHIKQPMMIRIKKETEGYVSGWLQLPQPYFVLQQTFFRESDFKQGILEIPVYLKENPPDELKAVLTLATAAETVHTQLVYDGLDQEEKRNRKKKERIQDAYFDFCAGRLSVEKFVQKELGILKEPPLNGQDSYYYALVSLHLTIISGKDKQVQNAFYIVEETGKKQLSRPEYYSYFLYLKALYTKDTEDIKKAVEYIKGCIETSPMKDKLFWLLIFMDEDIAFHPKKQLEMIQVLYENNMCSDLLLYEVVGIWNQDCSQIKELSEMGCQAALFGIRKKLLGRDVIFRLSSLMEREKIRTKSRIRLMMAMMEAAPESEILKAGCSLLIKGNCMQSCYHSFYHQGIKKGIQMVGLQEAYIRSIPKDTYPLLDHSVLLYFSYSSSLNQEDCAYLYANLLKNKDSYQDTFGKFEKQIRLFVLLQLKNHYLSDNMIVLYQAYFEQLRKSRKGKELLGNVMFSRKLKSSNSFFTRVSLFQTSLEGSREYSLQKPPVYLDVFEADPLLVFCDREGSRYIGSAGWNLDFVWNKSQVEAYLQCGDEHNDNYLIAKSIMLGKKDRISKEDLPAVYGIMDYQEIRQQRRHELYEKLLRYYSENGEKETLRKTLGHFEMSHLTPENRVTMTQYFIEANLFKEAFLVIAKYGFDQINPDCLFEATSHAIEEHMDQPSKLLIDMCETCFENNRYHGELLRYLQRYYDKDADQMLKIWYASSRESVQEESFTERLLLRYLTEAPKKEINAPLMQYVTDRGFQEDTILTNENPVKNLCIWSALEYYREHPESDQELFLFPPEVYCCTYGVFRGKPNGLFTLNGKGGTGDYNITQTMTELLPGYYVAQFLLFADDHFQFYVTEGNNSQEMKEQVFLIQSGRKDHESRFEQFNALLSEKNPQEQAEMMKEYYYKKSIIQYIEPFTEE